MIRLEGKVAIAIGAGSGTCRTIEVLYAKEGTKVVLADIIAEPKEGDLPTERIITDTGGGAVNIHCDMLKWSDGTKFKPSTQP